MVIDRQFRLEPGTLVPAIIRSSQQALKCGAMQPIETIEETVPDGGVEFIVRRVSSLERKEEDRLQVRETRARPNPFLPYDPDLFVADVSDSHLALLNKFNVIEGHLLIVTRCFVDQECLLDEEDFLALAACMAQMDGLGFYNGGRLAGASQAHKHLQLVPLPLGSGAALPMEVLLNSANRSAPRLPFRHAFVQLDPAWFNAPATGERLLACYRELLVAAGIGASAGDTRQAAPYNLLLTHNWMLIVPRSHESFEGISINALGFAGSFFVRDDGQLQALKRAGPMAALKAVALPQQATEP